ncbi:DUF423 domain-containing protein [Cohnella terricola]|uniref:DUF423 domain-containing protein n=1 Tax=Cohnella terricola TaxID=1289167 RepID=A0A559JBV5_9BACL|nr:DUF423 domain-containing protein [Cohnella terricola]TVX97366.1 DUF423 domain-containing protein [Cohnella terricola]
MNKYTKIGALAAMLSVVLGAFGAHMLKDRIDADALGVYQTGVQYHMFHAVGILLVALLIDRLASPKLAQWAARLLLIGIILFSGSLYALAISGVKVLGAITPIGGVAFIAGWICLAFAARPSHKK